MSPSITIDVRVISHSWSERVPGVVGLCETTVRTVFDAVKPPLGAAEVSIVLADAERSRILNRDYRGMDKPTNVLAFAVLDAPAEMAALARNQDAMPVPLGDVILAYEPCSEESAAQGKTFVDHLCHLVVHGMLHLLGYDHETQADAEKMERLEISVLAALDVPNPY